MQSFHIDSLIADGETKQRAWLEFLRTPYLSMGLYRLKAGQADEQQPHTEDEVYYVISGRAWFLAGQRWQHVGPGSLIYVERSVQHRFCDITEELTVLVFFAPPEGTVARQEQS